MLLSRGALRCLQKRTDVGTGLLQLLDDACVLHMVRVLRKPQRQGVPLACRDFCHPVHIAGIRKENHLLACRSAMSIQMKFQG